MQSDDTIPYGYCHCGCGEKTNLASQTRVRFGHVKGQPLRYVIGHNRRLSPVEYVEEDRGYKTPCWVWQRATVEGYGQVVVGGRTQLAHRVYYERKYGPIPDGLEPDHLCRVHPCVNPDHLEPVTRSVNNRRGNLAKLTDDDVRLIREIGHSLSTRVVGEMFGVSNQHVSNILQRKKWSDLT